MNDDVKRAAKAIGKRALRSGLKAFARAGESVAEDVEGVVGDADRAVKKIKRGFATLVDDLFQDRGNDDERR